MKLGKKGEVGLVPGEAPVSSPFSCFTQFGLPLKDFDQVYRNLILPRDRSLFFEQKNESKMVSQSQLT